MRIKDMITKHEFDKLRYYSRLCYNCVVTRKDNLHCNVKIKELLRRRRLTLDYGKNLPVEPLKPYALEQ